MSSNIGYWKPEDTRRNPIPITGDIYIVTFFKPTYTPKAPTILKDKSEKSDRQNDGRRVMGDSEKAIEYKLLNESFNVYVNRVHNNNSRNGNLKEAERIVDREFDEKHYLGEHTKKRWIFQKSREKRLIELAEGLATINRVFRLAPVNEGHKDNMELLIRDARAYFTTLDNLVH